MLPKVVITSIEEQYLLSEREFEYIRDNLNSVLPLANIWWDKDGQISHLTIHIEDTVLTLFGGNKIKGEFYDGTEFQLG